MMTEPTPTPGGQNDDQINRLVAILVGTLVAMTVMAVVFGVVMTLSIIWGCKLQRRRREMREMVERTKSSILEVTGPRGVVNPTPYDTTTTTGELSLHNVLDTSPGPLDKEEEGSGGAVFTLPEPVPDSMTMSICDSGARLTATEEMK